VNAPRGADVLEVLDSQVVVVLESAPTKKKSWDSVSYSGMELTSAVCSLGGSFAARDRSLHVSVNLAPIVSIVQAHRSGGAVVRRGTPIDSTRYSAMSWIPTSRQKAPDPHPGTTGEVILATVRHGLILVGLANTARDPVSARRAANEAQAVLRTVREMHAETTLPMAEDSRIRRGIDALMQALRSY
jgi:hypothetical protein